jgi:hypothetical protein
VDSIIAESTPVTRTSPPVAIAAVNRVPASIRLHDLGLAGGVLEDGPARGQARRHHDVLGAVDGGQVERDLGALESGAGRLDVAVLESDLRTQGLEALQVLVDGPDADRAAAGLGDPGDPAARQQRTQHQEGCAHLAHQVVGRFRRCVQRAGVYAQGVRAVRLPVPGAPPP